MKISAGTDIGKIRATNQDSYEIGELPDGGAWAVVCDGMGGHAGGHVASRMAVDRIAKDIRENFRNGMSPSSVKNILESSIVAANLEIYDRSQNDDEVRGMGTTAVAAVCTGENCVIANVGDSRCYKLSAEGVTQITKDHSLVQEMVDAGLITPEQAAMHPRKNVITRALGIEEDVAVDFTELSLAVGDMLLLCSDGLSNLVTNEEMTACTSDGNIFDYAERLIGLANEKGGQDNITAVIIA